MMKKMIALALLACCLLVMNPIEAKRGEPVNPITVEYDKFKDRTFHTLQAQALEDPSNYSCSRVICRMSVQAYYSYKGQTAQKPEHVLLLFRSHSDDWRFLNNHDLTFIADQERFSVEKTDRESDVSGGVWEYVTAYLTVEQFQKIAYAQNVEFRLGSSDFALSPSQLYLFRQLADSISPPEVQKQSNTFEPGQYLLRQQEAIPVILKEAITTKKHNSGDIIQLEVAKDILTGDGSVLIRKGEAVSCLLTIQKPKRGQGGIIILEPQRVKAIDGTGIKLSGRIMEEGSGSPSAMKMIGAGLAGGVIGLAAVAATSSGKHIQLKENNEFTFYVKEDIPINLLSDIQH